MMKIGFVGLGRMGKWMAGNIAKQGFDITVFDIDPGAMEYPVGLGAMPATSLSDVSKASNVVILSLPNADIINSGSGRSFASEFFIPKMLDGRFRGTYSLGSAYKDMQHMQGVSKQLDIFLPNFYATLGTYGKALNMGLEDEDKGAMLKIFEKELEVLFRK